MRAALCSIGLLASGAALASAATVSLEEVPTAVSPVLSPAAAPAAAAFQPTLNLSIPALAPSAIAQAETAAAPSPDRPATFAEKIQGLSASVAKAAAPSHASADQSGAAANRQFAVLTGETPAEEEPSAEDVEAARRAFILRNPTLPPSVLRVVERETGLTPSHPLFEHIAQRGSQPRNSHTNEPLGEAHRPVNPNSVLAGLFRLRQDSPAYYQSLRNPITGVVATGMRGGVDTMVEDLLGKGFIQPRSAGRNLRFLNGVYMDLPHDIHEARKYAAVDPYRTEGKDRYPMYVAFRAGNVHNPGADYQGRIVGDGGTLGHVALDQITPGDVVSIYVEKSRLTQTVARLKGTALAHVQVLPMDVLPLH